MSLRKALENIANKAPIKEVSAKPTVGPAPHWTDDYQELVADMVWQAFNQGRARACWELGQIADAALKKTGCHVSAALDTPEQP